jgi:hypothetical protein
MMLHGKKEFGRKRGIIRGLINEIDNFMFGNAAD